MIAQEIVLPTNSFASSQVNIAGDEYSFPSIMTMMLPVFREKPISQLATVYSTGVYVLHFSLRTKTLQNSILRGATE